MNKKSINFTSADIIDLRNKICKTKTKYWHIIKTENKMRNKAKAASQGSGFDLKTLYNQILQMTEHLIKIKLMLNDLNHGIEEFDYEAAKKTHYYNIFLASEKKEQLAHWEEILAKSTINPTAKKKAGKMGTGWTETFTAEKITSIKKSLQLEINKLDADIAKFNEESTISISEDDINDMKLLISA